MPTVRPALFSLRHGAENNPATPLPPIYRYLSMYYSYLIDKFPVFSCIYNRNKYFYCCSQNLLDNLLNQASDSQLIASPLITDPCYMRVSFLEGVMVPLCLQNVYSVVMATLAKRKRTKASIMVFSSISKRSEHLR